MYTSELWTALHLDSCTRFHVGDVCAVDLLPYSKIQNLPRIFIVNTDLHYMTGQHWVCIYIDPHGPIEFFDSLGRHPKFYSKLFEKFIYKQNNTFLYSRTPMQDNASTTCGQFCLFYSVHRCRGMPMHAILQKFSKHTRANDKIVLEFMENHFGSSHVEGPTGKDFCQNCLSPDNFK